MSTFTNLLFHILYSTKFRKPTIEKAWQDELDGYFVGIIRENKGTLLSAGGAGDHVHLLAKISPTVAISDMLRLIKTNSSKMVNERIKPKASLEWQVGYGDFSVSESQVGKVKEHILNQAEHHRHRTFQQEFIAMLERHQIKFHPKFVLEQEVTQ